jgi:AAA+ ATPase superfamily predicted ATPase
MNYFIKHGTKMEFTGRSSELRIFRDLQRKHTSSLVVVCGRRRIGKSTLIRQAAKQADHFLNFEGLAPCESLTKKDQLESFALRLSQHTALPKLTLDNWPQAFQLLAGALPRDGWTILLLDEISWMSIGERNFAGHLKNAWDNHFSQKGKLIVVLCGSVSSWIDRNILNSTGFVGRCSHTFKLAPLSLAESKKFLGKRSTAAEQLRILAVTGGIPKYLEEINRSQTAEQNIHRLCFDPGGILYNEFEQIFHDIFNRRHEFYRQILHALVDGSRSVSQVGKRLKVARGGTLTDALEDLASSGFITADQAFDPISGKSGRTTRYRLSDNYLRFYLKYVEPQRPKIDKGFYKTQPLETLPNWDTIMGLQFENLLLANLDPIRSELGLETTPIINAGPHTQTKTKQRSACQIDLLIRTRRCIYVIEAKFRDQVPRSVTTEIEKKIGCLAVPKKHAIRTALIYQGKLENGIAESEQFDHIIPFENLMGA